MCNDDERTSKNNDVLDLGADQFTTFSTHLKSYYDYEVKRSVTAIKIMLLWMSKKTQKKQETLDTFKRKKNLDQYKICHFVTWTDNDKIKGIEGTSKEIWPQNSKSIPSWIPLSHLSLSL